MSSRGGPLGGLNSWAFPQKPKMQSLTDDLTWVLHVLLSPWED